MHSILVMGSITCLLKIWSTRNRKFLNIRALMCVALMSILCTIDNSHSCIVIICTPLLSYLLWKELAELEQCI